jgi:hypothetical protein
MMALPANRLLPPLRAGEGWGGVRAQRAAGAKRSPQSIFLDISYTLKPKQPHPNPPLLPQGREPIMASNKPARSNEHPRCKCNVNRLMSA